MRIVKVNEITVPISSAIRNAVIDFGQMTVSFLALVSDVVRNGRSVVGFGFNSNGRYAQGAILRERFIPRLLAAESDTLLNSDRTNFDPERISRILMTNEKPGGHGERSVAVGVIDMAVWDLVAKIEDRPLHEILAERYRGGEADDRVFVYAAGGYYYPEKTIRALQDEMRGYLDLGYTVVKMKIGGAPLEDDLRRIEAVLDVVGDGSALAVDANGHFDLDQAIAVGEALTPYNLRWYEEPGDPLDFALHAALTDSYSGPLATGENLFSHQDVRNLVRYAGIRPNHDVLQMDPALSYGLVEYLRMLEIVTSHGVSCRQLVPHGGHQFALAIASGIGLGGNESYPGVFQPFGGFADDTPVEDGTVALPDAPGIGLELKSSLHPLLKQLQI